ncbi:hypothetical protein M407DRAFT_244564 [Tulasnella calospora MUT 4182]|uniref:Translation initiation factor IF2/IF5 domain-containing protein n=1 Tax=Tulasnella calospora MUT 4182 TaxID=1051891 RepID=A0A0C3LRR0_9AGAM|nr:hypothetical protein M407DRAFT_244564 [Tulasnella calospora MUT 4182]
MAEVDLTPAADEPMFDPSLKKKKPKKKQVVFNEEPAPEPPKETRDPSPVPTPGPSILKPSSEEAAIGADAGEEKREKAAAVPDDFGFGDLKKKKKKKEIPLDFGEGDGASPAGVSTPAEDGATPADDLNDFSDVKRKKKKSTKKITFDIEEFEKGLGDSAAASGGGEGGGAEGEEGDLGDDVFAMPAAPVDIGDETETWHGTDRDYTYSELLGRIVKTLRSQNPDLSAGGRKRYTIVPPSIHREGNKKTIFANVSEICKRMHRQPDHVIQFLFAELGTNGTVDGSQRLVIKGRFQQKQIETVLRRYIVEYVTCKICKSPDTLLSKENRLYFMTCESCGSRRSVSAIKTGFQAQVGKRKLTKPPT